MGLHTCGDLGSSLSNFFCHSDRVRLLAFVGCCHMKLTSFPMSHHVRASEDLTEKASRLGYLARELSCHAVETYVSRLVEPAEAEKLKVHCYRALLEKLVADSRYGHFHISKSQPSKSPSLAGAVKEVMIKETDET